jgi:hypothetical protein
MFEQNAESSGASADTRFRIGCLRQERTGGFRTLNAFRKQDLQKGAGTRERLCVRLTRAGEHNHETALKYLHDTLTGFAAKNER